MKNEKRGFDGSNFQRRPAAKSAAKVDVLATEAAQTRALEAFAHATKIAADQAHAAGVSISGRRDGQLIKIAPDGTVTKILEICGPAPK